MIYSYGNEYNTCIRCGANLDFDEVCDCDDAGAIYESDEGERLNAE